MAAWEAVVAVALRIRPSGFAGIGTDGADVDFEGGAAGLEVCDVERVGSGGTGETDEGWPFARANGLEEAFNRVLEDTAESFKDTEFGMDGPATEREAVLVD